MILSLCTNLWMRLVNKKELPLCLMISSNVSDYLLEILLPLNMWLFCWNPPLESCSLIFTPKYCANFLMISLICCLWSVWTFTPGQRGQHNCGVSLTILGWPSMWQSPHTRICYPAAVANKDVCARCNIAMLSPTHRLRTSCKAGLWVFVMYSRQQRMVFLLVVTQDSTATM